MIKLFPHLYMGNNLYHHFFPRKANPILYITNRCNSRCKICNHWQQTPKIDLCVNTIKALLKAKSFYQNNFIVEGGETTLHPYFDEIMELFKGRNFMLLTNGIDTERLTRATIKYKIPHIHISLDGLGKTYEDVRGVDKFRNVLNTIDALKDKTDVAVNFTISPWNNICDYLSIKQYCKRKKVQLLINIIAGMKYMGLTQKEELIDDYYRDFDKRPYIQLYNRWVKGEIKIPCLAVRFTTIIRPNGDIMLCQYKDTVFGNLYDQPFDEIWNSEKTKSIQKECITCNDCWVSSHRAFDARLMGLKKFKIW